MQVTRTVTEMEMCSCCGDDLSSGEKKKKRRQLSTQYGKKLMEILIKLMLEQ